MAQNLTEAPMEPQAAAAPLDDSITISTGPSTRFEQELEFVQMLANPGYLQYLATNRYMQKEEFVNYLAYLQYFTKEPYLRYVQWPRSVIYVLQLLQSADFRRDIIANDAIARLNDELYQLNSETLASVRALG